MTTSLPETHVPAAISAADNLGDLHHVMRFSHYTPGWHRNRAALWPEPRTSFRPTQWRYSESKQALIQAGRWMSTEEAERRNLIMANPMVDENQCDQYSTVRTLVAAYQMIKPGEYAKAHRHSPNALRLVLEAGDGVHTVVDGKQLTMRAGDVLLTPGHGWHSHFNEGEKNAYWIDYLDVPLVQLLEPMFVEHFPGGTQTVDSFTDDPTLVFRAAMVRNALDQSLIEEGVRAIILPSQGKIQTMELRFTEINSKANLLRPRSTVNRVVTVCKGICEIQVGPDHFELNIGDTLAIPCWNNTAMLAPLGALLCEVSDEPTQRALGFYKQEQ